MQQGQIQEKQSALFTVKDNCYRLFANKNPYPFSNKDNLFHICYP